MTLTHKYILHGKITTTWDKTFFIILLFTIIKSAWENPCLKNLYIKNLIRWLWNCFNVFVWFVLTNVGLNKRNGISNKQSLSKWTLNHLLTNTQPFSQIGQMIELGCEYLPVRCIWLYVIIMSRKHFRVNLDSIVGWISRKSKHTRYLKFKWQQRYSNQQPLGS